MASMNVHIRFAGGSAVALLLGGWLPGLAVQAPPAPASDTRKEEASPDWARLKTLWRVLDQGGSLRENLYAELALCFGLPEPEFSLILDRTEQVASGIHTSRKVLSPETYGLATLAISHLNSSPYEPPPPTAMTRMAVLLPGMRESNRLQSMEMLSQRIEEMRGHRRKGTLSMGIVRMTLAGIRRDVYHHRALRLAVELHRKEHPAGEPAGTPPAVYRGAFEDFLRDPSASKVGTDAWLRGYEQAVEGLRKELPDPEAAQLRREQKAFKDVLDQLEAARPRLATLIAKLERTIQ